MTGEGQKIDPIGVGDYASITAPNDPVREGYVFDGWYKESTYDNLWNFNTEKVIADTTLYAKWVLHLNATIINFVVVVFTFLRCL